MDDVINWLIAMKPFWLLAAWLASSVFGAFVALEKNRCGLCWFLMGVLFGPLALIATVGLPVKPPSPPESKLKPKPDTPEVAHAPLVHASASHPAAAHSAAHHPVHAPAAHPTVAHATSHHPQPAHTPVKQGFLESAMERPAAGVAVAAVVVLLLLVYFGSRHL